MAGQQRGRRQCRDRASRNSLDRAFYRAKGSKARPGDPRDPATMECTPQVGKVRRGPKLKKNREPSGRLELIF